MFMGGVAEPHARLGRLRGGLFRSASSSPPAPSRPWERPALVPASLAHPRRRGVPERAPRPRGGDVGRDRRARRRPRAADRRRAGRGGQLAPRFPDQPAARRRRGRGGEPCFVESRAPGRRAFPDLGGSILLGAGLALLTLGIVQGPEWGWSDPVVVGSFVGAAVAFALFVRSRRGTACRYSIRRSFLRSRRSMRTPSPSSPRWASTRTC